MKVDSLVPKPLSRGKYTSAFLPAFARYDAAMAERVKRAAARGNVLRYVGTLENGQGERRSEGVPAHASDRRGEGQRQRHRVHDQALCADAARRAGPGAGADVTAMGVFSDILKLLHYLPR